MNELVKKLSEGDHPVEIVIRPKAVASEVKRCIDNGFIHVKFTDTKGGTELGLHLIKEKCNVNADFEQSRGQIKLVGRLTLDYVKVECNVQIDLSSFKGQGRLFPV